jgi:hypothetical protein
MAVSGMSLAASSHMTSQQAASTSNRQRQSAQKMPSLTDIDAQGSSVMTAPSATGKIGSKINISA